MSNKLTATKLLGIVINAMVTTLTDNPGTSYVFRPQGEAPSTSRPSGKQAIAINLALRPQGVSVQELRDATSETGKKYDTASAKSYLGKDFAGKKGYGIYPRVLSVQEHLGEFTNDEEKAAAEKALLVSQKDAPESVGVVVMHCYHDVANVGRQPQASDFEVGSMAHAAIFGGPVKSAENVEPIGEEGQRQDEVVEQSQDDAPKPMTKAERKAARKAAKAS